MKNRFGLLILLGVIGLGSCTSYRIKEVSLLNGGTYYFPQKRVGLEFIDLSKEGSYTKEWAYRVVDEDMKGSKPKIKYIKINQ
jgi:hypothetical protein